MEIKIDGDLREAVDHGDYDEWEAMQIQTCRDAAYAREMVDDIQKKMAERDAEVKTAQPEKKRNPIRFVSR